MDTLNFGLVVEPLLACNVCAKVQIEVTTFIRVAQPLGHTLIALNRFTYEKKSFLWTTYSLLQMFLLVVSSH